MTLLPPPPVLRVTIRQKAIADSPIFTTIHFVSYGFILKAAKNERDKNKRNNKDNHYLTKARKQKGKIESCKLIYLLLI
jgi:hypothetical protein